MIRLVAFGLFWALLPGALLGGPNPLILRLAEIHPPEYPTTQGDREFARQVATLSGGRIQVEVYDNGVLGEELAVLDQIRFGGIDIARVSVASVQPFLPRLAALFMPYLYEDDQHMWRVLTGPVGLRLQEDLEKGGLVGIGWFEAGSRCFYTTKAPLRVVSDLRGLRIRVQESQPMVGLVRALGGLAVPLTFTAVYSGLRTGQLDGAENNLATYYASGHYRAAPYMTLDRHARLPEVLVGSPVTFAGIDAADRRLILEAAARAAEFQRKAWAEYEAAIIEKLRVAGVVLVEPENLAEWKQRAKATWEGQSAEVRDLLREIQAAR